MNVFILDPSQNYNGTIFGFKFISTGLFTAKHQSLCRNAYKNYDTRNEKMTKKRIEEMIKEQMYKLTV